MADVAIIEPGEMDTKPKMVETIFNHIRRKSKSFPDLITLKTRDPSHQPLILTEVNTSMDQSALDSSRIQKDSVILIDSEPAETIVTSINQCIPESSKPQEDSVILINKEPFDTFTESDQPAKHTLESDVLTFDGNKRFTNKKQFFSLENGDKLSDPKLNLIQSSTNSASNMNSEICTAVAHTLSNQLNKRKLGNNWIDDVMVSGNKRHKSELSSDFSTTRSHDLSSSRIKPEESELCDKLIRVTTEGCGNSVTSGPKPNRSLDPQGTPRSSGSMEVSYLGFKSVFSFL